MSGETLPVARSVGGLEDLGDVKGGLGTVDEWVLTCGAVMFPAAQAMNVIARVVDFLVCPATLREMREKTKLPSAR